MIEKLHRLEGPGDRRLVVRIQGDPIYRILASKEELAVYLLQIWRTNCAEVIRATYWGFSLKWPFVIHNDYFYDGTDQWFKS